MEQVFYLDSYGNEVIDEMNLKVFKAIFKRLTISFKNGSFVGEINQIISAISNLL